MVVLSLVVVVVVPFPSSRVVVVGEHREEEENTGTRPKKNPLHYEDLGWDQRKRPKMNRSMPGNFSLLGYYDRGKKEERKKKKGTGSLI